MSFAEGAVGTSWGHKAGENGIEFLYNPGCQDALTPLIFVDEADPTAELMPKEVTGQKSGLFKWLEVGEANI